MSSDALSGTSTPDLSSTGNKLSSAAEEAKAKAKSAFKGISSLSSHPLAELADLNADVRGAAGDYRDPAGAIQQDKAAGKFSTPKKVVLLGYFGCAVL
jgi:hypothetical protein